MRFLNKGKRLKSPLLSSKLSLTWMESWNLYFRWGSTFLLIWLPRHNYWGMNSSYFHLNDFSRKWNSKKWTSACLMQKMNIKIQYIKGSSDHRPLELCQWNEQNGVSPSNGQGPAGNVIVQNPEVRSKVREERPFQQAVVGLVGLPWLLSLLVFPSFF